MAGISTTDPAFRRVAVALFLAGVATFAGLYATQPLLPLLASEFGVSAAASALSVSLTTATLGIGLLVAAPVSEVRGRTVLITGSLLTSSALGIVCAFAPGWPVLLVLRALEGFALAGLPAVATAYLREEVAGEAYARATGLYIAGTAIGGMAGRLVAGGVAEVAGWRGAVAAVGGMTLLCALAVTRLLPPSRGFVPSPADPRALLRRYGVLLADPVLLGLYAIGATLMGAFVAVYNALGFRLEAAPYALSVGAAGLVYLVYPLGSVGSALGGRAAGRFGNRPVVPVGIAVMAAGILLTLAAPLPVVVAGTALMTFGFFVAHAVASGWVAARAAVGAGGPGQAASLYLLAYYGGSSVAGALVGTAWTAGGWPAVVALTGSLAGVAALLALALVRTRSLAPPAR
ncbi:MAG: MFS transporter [Actinomycetota bacterium]|nr:MFS transporter [Actinomycetota bacterium]